MSIALKHGILPFQLFSVEDIINEGNVEKEKEKHVNTLTYEQEGELSRLKESFSDVISDILGRTGMVEHTIHTDDASPIRLPPYRLPHSSHEYLRNEIKTLLEQKIIMPSKSPWAAPVVLVPKKKMVPTKRLCIDYRKLNLVTQADPYPIPRIEELIDGIGSSRWIMALDLTKGYWQVPMERTSQEKTAFITPWGKYEFTTMPFGLIAASINISKANGQDIS